MRPDIPDAAVRRSPLTADRSRRPVAWLNDPAIALPDIAVPGIWLGFGITTLIMLAGLFDIPQSYYESASLDGAGFWAKTWYVAIPSLKNVLLYLLVIGFILSMQEFLLPLLMTNGGPAGATTTQWGLLMAGSTLAALPTIILVLIFQRYIVNGVRLAGMKQPGDRKGRAT